MPEREKFDLIGQSLRRVVANSLEQAYKPQELIDNLKTLARILGRIPTSRDLSNRNINKGPAYSPYRAAGLNYWLEQADLKPKSEHEE